MKKMKNSIKLVLTVGVLLGTISCEQPDGEQVFINTNDQEKESIKTTIELIDDDTLSNSIEQEDNTIDHPKD